MIYVCVLPDLFDFLSDGFGERERLCLNPLDGHRPAVTREENYFNTHKHQGTFENCL